MYGSICLVALSVFTGNANGAIDESVQGVWLFDEGSGSEVLDSSGKEHHGAFTADDIQRVNGMFGGALEFFGGGEVVIPHDDAFTSPTFTLMAWIKVHEIPSGWTTRLIAKDGWPDRNYAIYVLPGSGVVHFAFCAPGQSDVGNVNGNTNIADDQWHHVAVTYDLENRRIYVDGELDMEAPMNIVPSENTVDIQIGTGPVGLMDEVLIATEAFSEEDIKNAMQAGLKDSLGIVAEVATRPGPANGAEDVIRDVELSWQASEFAVKHNVYFDSNPDAVNADDPSVLIAEGLDVNSLTLEMPLDYGKIYYWRVDEVNGAPDYDVFKGEVWSFTVESFAYPIAVVTATASSSGAGQGPENTVNGSGLDASDQHSMIAADMWLSDFFGPQPTWIRYEFDKAYVLHELWVWNSNQMIETSLGVGCMDVTIEYSQDGEAWTILDDVRFNQAPGDASYTANTTVDMKGVVAQFVRLTPQNNWMNILEQYGLSEVRFFFIPVQAREPSPALGELDVNLDVMLSWRQGREAASHDISFGTDIDAVIDGTAFVETVTENSYQPGTLDYGQRYYWKINEVNEAASTPIREGEIWSFSTIESFAAEDFEGYSAEVPIWESWLDGLGFGVAGTADFNPGNGTGSAVGDDTTPSFTEETIVHGGGQSMPLFYNNNKAGLANYSETQHTLDQTGDWAKGGVTQLSLWFRGYQASVGSFVEGPAGTFTMAASGADIWDNADEFHYAYKMLSGQGSIVAMVQSVENNDSWAKAGVMIRETLDPDSAHTMVVVTPAEGVSFQRRAETAGISTHETTGGITAPYWVKIERDLSGNFTGYRSADGSSWERQGLSEYIQMGANVYIGLAVTAHNASATCEAVFTNVTTTGTVTGQWSSRDIGIQTNDAETLYVGIADTAGNVGVVEHEDPDAAQIGAWTQWAVDLAEFANQGVNLAEIQKIILGLGNRDNPVAGGSGKMYIDDIEVGNPVPIVVGAD
jgi:hypothetical protein